MKLRSGAQKENPVAYAPRKSSGSGDDCGSKRQKTSKSDQDLVLLKSARSAVPALFAKPGDLFEWHGSRYGDVDVVEYVGRNTVPSKQVEFRGEMSEEYKSPKKGWLIFKNAGGAYPLSVTNGGLRDACKAWPLACKTAYNEEGEMVEGTMCIPPEDCGALVKQRDYEGDMLRRREAAALLELALWQAKVAEQADLGQGGIGKHQCRAQCGAGIIIPNVFAYVGEEDVEEPEEEIVVTKKLLQEAKRAFPLLFAQPGDLFEWYDPTDCSFEGETTVIKYVGRNKFDPKVLKSKNPNIRKGYEKVDCPQLGWLIFKNRHKRENYIDVCNGGIRDGIGAWPLDIYSAYNSEGKRISGTLCVPFEKCGTIRKHVPPRYDDYW